MREFINIITLIAALICLIKIEMYTFAGWKESIAEIKRLRKELKENEEELYKIARGELNV
jgi:hypothetical protein